MGIRGEEIQANPIANRIFLVILHRMKSISTTLYM